MKSFLKKIKKRNWITVAAVMLIYLGNVFCSAFNKQTQTQKNYTNNFVGSEACKSCHKQIYDSFIRTAHYFTSRPASREFIKGSFDSGKNIYTYNKFMYVEMDQAEDSFYQTAMINGIAFESASFDIVVGSARKGQTYLYWNGARLYQLPVSYYTAQNSWCNSPGYPSTLTKFNRQINAQCIECHSTYAKAEYVNNEVLFAGHQIMYGIQCERCHGPGEQHVAYFIAHPHDAVSKYIINARHLSRQQQLDACALCHSGLRKETQPSFSFAVGDTLDNYSTPNYNSDSTAMLDVHGNQYGLLTSSKCFRMSQMNCSSCHNVHTNEYGNEKIFSQRCLNCHNTNTHDTCMLKERQGLVLADNCVDCHMPLQPSKKIFLQLVNREKSTADLVRTHKIAVYVNETKNYILKHAQLSTIKQN